VPRGRISLVELDRALQMLAHVRRTTNARLGALVFANAVEEDRVPKKRNIFFLRAGAYMLTGGYYPPLAFFACFFRDFFRKKTSWLLYLGRNFPEKIAIFDAFLT
jgi:hypothetical protein